MSSLTGLAGAGREGLRAHLDGGASMLGAFMAVLGIQITNSSLKDILGTLSATQEEGSWIATAYLVAEIIMIPMTGLLARVFGMRAYMMGTTRCSCCSPRCAASPGTCQA
jgi:MFS family permease